MRTPPSYLNLIGRFLLFMAIEALSIAMICNNDTIQRLSINENLREIGAFFWKKGNDIKSYLNLRSVNEEITQQNTFLLAENERLRDAITKFAGDSLIHQFTESHSNSLGSHRYMWAKVIRNTAGKTTHNYLIINKGYKDGVGEDMGVITPFGVVGIIRSAGANHSLVVSFLNTKQVVSARLGKSNMFGSLAWDGISNNRAILNDIPQHADVIPGDTVYTSGYSTIYPANVPVGVVESSKIVNGMHKAVDVKLFQDYRALDNVIIAQNKNFKEIDSLSRHGEKADY